MFSTIRNDEMTKEKAALLKTMKDQAQRHYKILLDDGELFAECIIKIKEFNSMDSLVAKHGLVDREAVLGFFKGHCECDCDHVYHPEYPPGDSSYWHRISRKSAETLAAEVKKGEIKCAHTKDKLQKAREGTQRWREILADHKASRWGNHEEWHFLIEMRGESH